MSFDSLHKLLRHEAAGGICLMVVSVAALIVANSAAAPLYEAFSGWEIGIPGVKMRPLVYWVNEGLMAVFFLLVALEIKREILAGALRTRQSAMLPALAALGGMVVPALIYAAFNWGDAAALRGWAIPMATDIAFALGVMALVGSRVPAELKVLLTAIAVVDDLGAILVIAIFYSHGLALPALALAFACIVGLFTLNRFGVTRLVPYLIIGVVMWVAVLQSGLHATLAGVALGFFIPFRDEIKNPLVRLEHALAPGVTFFILPLFGFLNAGVVLNGIDLSAMLAPLPLGIMAGLFIGKQVGVFCAIWLAVKGGLAPRPQASWSQIYSVSILAGIGFTMSLFIGDLAFNGAHAAELRLSILIASFIAALAGFLVLRSAGSR